MRRKFFLFTVSLLVGCNSSTINEKTTTTPTPSLNDGVNTEQCLDSKNHMIELPTSIISSEEKRRYCTQYKETQEEVTSFFEKHPEYMESEKKENELLIEYNKLLQEKKYQQLRIYQILSIAHQNRIKKMSHPD